MAWSSPHLPASLCHPFYFGWLCPLRFSVPLSKRVTTACFPAVARRRLQNCLLSCTLFLEPLGCCFLTLFPHVPWPLSSLILGRGGVYADQTQSLSPALTLCARAGEIESLSRLLPCTFSLIYTSCSPVLAFKSEATPCTAVCRSPP